MERGARGGPREVGDMNMIAPDNFVPATANRAESLSRVKAYQG